MALTTFTATGPSGAEPYVTDGTAAGTTLLGDIVTGAGGSSPFGYTLLSSGRALFVARDAAGAPLLWSTDGTAVGTVAVSALSAGFATDPGTFSATAVGGRLVFQGTNSVTNRIEVWATNGTSAGTSLLTTVRSGTAGFGADPITTVGSRAVFQERTADGQTALWATDGTAVGTSVIGNFAGFGTDTPGSLTAIGNGAAVFRAANGQVGAELWVTDGTAAGTTLLGDINLGPAASNPYGFTPLGDGRYLFGAIGRVGPGGANANALWLLDGNGAVTLAYVPAVQSVTLPKVFTAIGGGRVAFQASFLPGKEGSPLPNNELWVTDGTAAGTRLLLDTPRTNIGNPNSLTAIGNGRLIYQADSGSFGAETFLSDGTPGGTGLLRDINPGLANAGILNFVAIADGRAVFRADNGAAGSELWTTDGTTAGTVLLADVNPGSAASAPSGFLPLTPVALSPAPTNVQVSGAVADVGGGQFYFGVTAQDTVIFYETLRGASYTRFGSTTTIARPGQMDASQGVETLRFIDGRMTFDPQDPAAQVARLYQAGLGRLGEQSGTNFWIGTISAGSPLSQLAQGFLNSPEFIARFGSTLPNADFVTRIYQNVLGRNPEAEGLNFWTGNLNSGAATRSQTLAGISESPENKSVTSALVDAGIWDRSEAAQQVARLYDTALGRLPDLGGLFFWTRAIETGGGTLTDLAQSFVTSAEFNSTYGALANRGFVEAIYGNTLGRPGDQAGVDFWTNALNSGASRAQVTIGFSESAEHQSLVAADTGGETLATFGVRVA